MSFLETLAAMDPRYGEFRDSGTDELDAVWNDPKATAEERETGAMRLCADAWTRLAVMLAAKPGRRGDIEALEGLIGRRELPEAKGRTGPARRAESRVYWSNRLAALFPFLARDMAPDKGDAIEDIMADLLNNAEVTADRRDIHYQARMELLYNNNVRSLAAMMLLVLSQDGSPYRGDAMALRQSWDDSMGNPAFKVSDKITHSLLTAAQLSFPLAHWLASSNR
jgi:hypothetical protein